MTKGTRFRSIWALLGHLTRVSFAALVLTSGPGSAELAAQDLPDGAARCRQRLSGAVARYYKDAVRLLAECHRDQLRGNLPPAPELDCSDPSTWDGPASYERGRDRLQGRISTSFHGAISACGGDFPGAPSDLGLVACPQPCAAVVPAIDDFDDVGRCLWCLGDACITATVRATFGTPLLLEEGLDHGALACQTHLGRAVQDLGWNRLRLFSKCQYSKDRGRSGFAQTHCARLDLLSHPYHGRYARAVAKLQTRVALRCDASMLATVLDSCGTDIADEQFCLQAAVESCSDGLYGAIFAPVPEDTPSPTPTATRVPLPTLTPTVSGAPTPTSTQTSSPTPLPQTRCTSDTECASGFCADGVCCDAACDGTCQACRGAKTGGPDGLCLPIPQGSDPDAECDSGSDCRLATCDGAGACESENLPLGSSCGDAGTDCVVQDTCDDAGNCVDNGFLVAGTSCGDTATECSSQDTCDGAGQCLANDAPSGTTCGDAGSECIVQDTCDGGGSCIDNGFIVAGTACGDPSDSECDHPDSCDGGGSCAPHLELAGTLCGDAGTACTVQDTCDGGGACSDNGFAPAGSPCANDGNLCTDDECDGAGVCLHENNRSPCDDGVFCNGTDSCSAGACAVHSGDPCPGADGDVDCSETCNEAESACSAPDPAGTSCDDGLFCNGSDICGAAGECLSSGSPCVNGGAYGGDDDSDCRESCDELNNTCTAADPDGTPCNDNLFCTGGDVGNLCVLDEDCASGSCVDVCNSGRDQGRPCASDAECNGGSCTGRACASEVYTLDDGSSVAVIAIDQDRCLAGVCSGGAPPCPGDPTDAQGRGVGLSASCQDACDEDAAACTAPAADGADCRDADFCNGNADTCQAGSCAASGDPCVASPAFEVGDDDDDCTESCRDETACSGFGCIGAGSCTAPDPQGSSCNDGLFCTTGDACSAAGTCAGDPNAPPCPQADADGNCQESCDEDADSCTAADPDGSACDDGSFCNGTETCQAGACSASSGDPCVGPDGDGDCRESCDENADRCDAPDPAGASCDDDLFCTQTDTCNGSGACVGAGSPCAGADGDSNCRESCDEAADSCTAPDPVSSTCDDGLFCTTTDRCNAAGTCVGSGDPCPGADGDGDCSESCVEGGGTFTCNGNDPINSLCDDGLFCTSTDRCNAGGSCVGSGDPCTGADGDGNCRESCNESANDCSAPDPVGSSCADTLFCNGVETCNAAGSCVSSGNPCPGHNAGPNCADSCDESLDSCTANDQNGTSCNDGAFCNGADTCSNGSCLHAGNPCPGHNVGPGCADSCNEGNDSCTGHDPNGTSCNDGLFCNGSDSCSGGTCAHTGNPCPGADGDGDCRESCNEGADNCGGSDPNSSICNDGNAQTVDDICSGGNCAGTPFHALDAWRFGGLPPSPGRPGLDSFCGLVASSLFPQGCREVRALVSVNGSDTIRNMPSTFGFNSTWSIRSPDGTRKYADNWDDFTDGGWDSLLAPSSTLATYWTGSTATGGLGNNCNGWTTRSSSATGAIGTKEPFLCSGACDAEVLFLTDLPCNDTGPAQLCLCIR